MRTTPAIPSDRPKTAARSAQRPARSQPGSPRLQLPRSLPSRYSRAMLETCGSAGEGCTFPVTEWRFSSKDGVGAPTGRYHPILTVVPGEGPDHVAAKDGSLSLIDRKSTRLNSSHLGISYAVFCLKKKE